MKKTILYLLAMVVILLHSSSTPLDKRIFWKSATQLEWKNFQSAPDDDSPFKALTSWGIGYDIKYENGELTITHQCYFLPDKSWVKNGHRNDYLLNHERQHFNIAQIYARKFNGEIKEYKKNITKIDNKIGNDVSKIYDKIMKECVKEQQRYDKETEHSIDKEAQAKWDSYIQEALDTKP